MGKPTSYLLVPKSVTFQRSSVADCACNTWAARLIREYRRGRPWKQPRFRALAHGLLHLWLSDRCDSACLLLPLLHLVAHALLANLCDNFAASNLPPNYFHRLSLSRRHLQPKRDTARYWRFLWSSGPVLLALSDTITDSWQVPDDLRGYAGRDDRSLHSLPDVPVLQLRGHDLHLNKRSSINVRADKALPTHGSPVRRHHDQLVSRYERNKVWDGNASKKERKQRLYDGS